MHITKSFKFQGFSYTFDSGKEIFACILFCYKSEQHGAISTLSTSVVGTCTSIYIVLNTNYIMPYNSSLASIFSASHNSESLGYICGIAKWFLADVIWPPWAPLSGGFHPLPSGS